MTGGRLVIDTSKCTACRACMVACKQWHSLPSEDTAFTGSYQNLPDMSGANLTLVRLVEKEISGKLKWLFMKDQCRHCEGAWCKQSCPLRAIEKLPNGIVKIDPAVCSPSNCSALATKPCQSVCPFNVPKYQYVKDGSPVTTKMRKCDFCYDRLGNTLLPVGSRLPACMATCPPETMFGGGADAMWTKAVNYVKSLRSSGRFPHATIYPHQNGTWGPTHVIWILTEHSSEYGLPGYSY